MNWTYPKSRNKIIEFAKELGCDYIQSVEVIPGKGYTENNCHNNVGDYVTNNPGSFQVYGYYMIESLNFLQAIYHSVVETITGELIDITPYSDGRKKILFARSKKQTPDYRLRNFYYRI